MSGSTENAATGADHQLKGRLRRVALFDYGFRPFFLLAGLHAGLAMPVWMSFLYGMDISGMPLPALAWHAHELLYGFVMAAVAGFMLTAVPSWTSSRAVTGLPLLALALTWLAGRAAVTLPLGLPPAIVAAADLVFPLALAGAIAPPLLRSGSRRNLVFIVILAVLFTANLHFHLSLSNSADPLRLAINTVLLLVVVVGGRVTPAFTSGWLEQRGDAAPIAGLPWLDRSAVAAAVVILVVDVPAPDTAWAGGAALAGAALLLARLARWHGHRTWREPIVFVLHVGYAWLPVALGLKAAALLGAPVPGASWLHALTAGAFATMILAVMTRASLGHTGRAIVAPPTAVWAYVCITGAALCRALGPALAPSAVLWWLTAAAALWTLAFCLFLFTFAPMLCSPRVDDRL